MTKKIGWIVAAVLVVFVVFNMGMRRAHMMSGSTLPLAAVSADGKALPLPADVAAVTGKLSANQAAQKIGDMLVTFTLNPYPPSAGTLTTFDVKLTDTKGQALNDATVTLDMTMPEMWMPPNQPALGFVSDGKYSATGQFSMRGWWRIEVIITRGGQTQSAFFDVGL